MNDPLNIVFFGNSICVGQGVAVHHGWVTRISRELEMLVDALGRRIVVANASVNGDTTRLALERMPFAVQPVGAEILIVQFGLNDCNYWLSDNGLPRVSQEAFAANLNEIIYRGLIFGAKRVFVNTNHPTLRSSEYMVNATITFQQNNAKYNTIIRKVVAELPDNVILIDIEAKFERLVCRKLDTLEKLLLPDGVHLSKSGHDAYFAMVREPLDHGVKELYGSGGEGT